MNEIKDSGKVVDGQLQLSANKVTDILLKHGFKDATQPADS